MYYIICDKTENRSQNFQNLSSCLFFVEGGTDKVQSGKVYCLKIPILLFTLDTGGKIIWKAACNNQGKLLS